MFPVLKAIYAVPNGGHRDVRTAVKLKREGVKSGVWDVCVPIPSRKMGAPGMYIEFKAGKNGLTDNQKAFQNLLEPLGFHFVVAYNPNYAESKLKDYLDIPQLPI